MEPSLAPAGTFIGSNAYDPLRNHPSDFFWFHVEPCFRPLQEDDMVALEKLKQPVTVPEVDAPIAQRLVAALLDEGKGATNASRAIRTNTTGEPMWLPGALPSLRSFNRVFETRVRTELEDLGVLKHNEDDGALEQLRLDAWHVRNISASCTGSRSRVAIGVAEELTTQVTRRERKRENDLIEVKYLKKMMETGGKRGKSRFSKLLREMHPNHELAIGAPLPGAHANGDSNGGGGGHDKKSSKKKRKSSTSKFDSKKLEQISKGTGAIAKQSYNA